MTREENALERNSVTALFGQMTGLCPEQAAIQLPLIDACIRQIQARLRPGAQPGEILIWACAAMAACRYLTTTAPEPAVKAGEVTATPEDGSSRLERVKALKEEYLLSLAPYLTDPEFLFCQAVTVCG